MSSSLIQHSKQNTQIPTSITQSHPYIVFQLFIPSQNQPQNTSKEPLIAQAANHKSQTPSHIDIKIEYRDKQNGIRRFKIKGSEQAFGRVDSYDDTLCFDVGGLLQYGRWTNLCIDMNSLSGNLYPVVKERASNPERSAANSRSMVRSRGHSRTNADCYTGQFYGQNQLSHGPMNKSGKNSDNRVTNAGPYGYGSLGSALGSTQIKRPSNFKYFEQIQIQGQFKLRKIFTMRNKLQPDIDVTTLPQFNVDKNQLTGSSDMEKKISGNTIDLHPQNSFTSSQEHAGQCLPPSGRQSYPNQQELPGLVYQSAKTDNIFNMAPDFGAGSQNNDSSTQNKSGAQEDDVAQNVHSRQFSRAQNGGGSLVGLNKSKGRLISKKNQKSGNRLGHDNSVSGSDNRDGSSLPSTATVVQNAKQVNQQYLQQSILSQKSGYYESIPKKMDFPPGLKHFNQLIDFKAVCWIKDNPNNNMVNLSNYLMTVGEKGATDLKRSDRSNMQQNQKSKENANTRQLNSRNHSRGQGSQSAQDDQHIIDYPASVAAAGTVRRDLQNESRQSKGSSKVSGMGVDGTGMKRVSYNPKSQIDQHNSSHQKSIKSSMKTRLQQMHPSEANDMTSISSGTATGFGASGAKALVKQRSFVQKISSRRSSNKGGKDGNLFSGATDSEFEDDAYRANPKGRANSTSQNHVSNSIPKKVSTGGQRKNKFQEIPKAQMRSSGQSMMGAATNGGSGYHGAGTTSKKQTASSLQRIVSPKSVNQLFKVHNVNKSGKQRDDSQNQKQQQMSSQLQNINNKRRMGDTSELKLSMNPELVQEQKKARSSQVHSSLTRNSGHSGTNNLLATNGKLGGQNGLTLAQQRANQPASPPTFLTTMSSQYGQRPTPNIPQNSGGVNVPAIGTSSSTGVSSANLTSPANSALITSNHQNMPTTFSLQEVKEHSIQEEENDQMSFAVRGNTSDHEELEMIAEVVTTTGAGGAKKKQKAKNQIKEKRQALSKIYQQKSSQMADAATGSGADEKAREEKNKSSVGQMYHGPGSHHNISYQSSQKQHLGSTQGTSTKNQNSLPKSTSRLINGAINAYDSKGGAASGAIGNRSGGATKNQGKDKPDSNFHHSDQKKVAGYNPRKINPPKDYGTGGDMSTHSTSIVAQNRVHGGVSHPKASKTVFNGSGEDKGNGKMEEYSGVALGSDVKRVGGAGGTKGQVGQQTVSKVQERLNRAQKNRQMAQMNGKNSNKSPDLVSHPHPQNSRPSHPLRNDSQGKFQKLAEGDANKSKNYPTQNTQAAAQNSHYSATKSQANITNNNFAKFSSSGYTNNNFLLASGHHDFIPSDFQIMSNGKQTGGNWNLDASQIEKNLKSTVKSKQDFNQQPHPKNLNVTPSTTNGAQNQNFMLNTTESKKMSKSILNSNNQQVSTSEYYTGPTNATQTNYIEVQNHLEQSREQGRSGRRADEIEESIIEEEIEVGTGGHNGGGAYWQGGAQSPTSPLINSRTKGKGKLDLFMMRPPKPDILKPSRHCSNDRTSPAAKQQHFLGVIPSMLHVNPQAIASKHLTPGTSPFSIHRSHHPGGGPINPKKPKPNFFGQDQLYGGVIDEEGVEGAMDGFEDRQTDEQVKQKNTGSCYEQFKSSGMNGHTRDAGARDDEIYDPSVLLAGPDHDSQGQNENHPEETYDAMYDILVPGSSEQQNNLIGATGPAETGRSSGLQYQRTISQDRLDLMMDKQEYYGDRTEVPSINGGLPITMQVRKEGSYGYGGGGGAPIPNSGNTKLGLHNFSGGNQSNSTLAMVQPPKQVRRPFSPPIKYQAPATLQK